MHNNCVELNMIFKRCPNVLMSDNMEPVLPGLVDITSLSSQR